MTLSLERVARNTCNGMPLSAMMASYDPFITSLSFGWEHFAPFAPPMQVRDDTGSAVERESAFGSNRKVSTCASKPNLRTKDIPKSPKKRSRTVKASKSVTFSNLAIREHAVIVGDNPSARRLPIALSWAHTEEPTLHDIDSYEQARTGRRRRGECMRLSYVEKRLLLIEHGIPEDDIRRAQHDSDVHSRGRTGCYSLGGKAGDDAGDDGTSSSTIRRVKTLAALATNPFS
jgi:hypothetical protein